jgi:tetratricopeptide (TPR) repeat protein
MHSKSNRLMKHVPIRILPQLLIFLLLLLSPSLNASTARILYSSLDPQSIPQHLAFYELFPNSKEGEKALEHAWKLLSGGRHSFKQSTLTAFSPETLNGLINLVNKPADAETPLLTETELQMVDNLASRLPNRKLRGSSVRTEKEVLALPPDQVDLARGLFLTQLGEDKWETILSYEAMIDLMALQLLTKVSFGSSPQEKIQAISSLIFDEMGFRFPPHSLYAKDVDLYTFLPSVLDSRQGVCLGVSILYLCLAQRLDLTLEAITPPGHIYVRWKQGTEVRNIETTARGVHIDSEEYLGIETRELEQKNIKEVIGLAHINQASVYLHEARFSDARESYEKALPYLPDYILIKELLGYTYVFVGEEAKGRNLLEQVRGRIPAHSITPSSLVEDYLDGKVEASQIQILFRRVDDDRASIFNKKQDLEKSLANSPYFKDGWRALAITWLQLHREKEALKVLEHCHTLCPDDPTVEYYLAALLAGRMDYQKAWEHLKTCESLVHSRDHDPKGLKQLRKQLSMLYPD